MPELKLNISSEFEEQIEELFYRIAKEVISEVSKQEINSKDFLTFKEAAEYVGVSFNTLKTFITKYGLKTITIGGKKFIHKPTIVKFMKSFEQ